MINRTHSIPIVLLTGFLGAGKTSVLNYLLKQNHGLKIGVIVNDFGDINIDSLLVSAQTDTQLELTNGCICCSVDDGELDDAISQLAYKGSTLDYIVIEASGLAEPKDLANMLRLMRNRYAHFDSVITVVDAANFAKNNKVHTSALANLNLADIVIINKVDLVTQKALDEIISTINFASPQAKVVRAEQGQVDPRLLLNSDLPLNNTRQLKLTNGSNDHDHEHLHESFSSVSFTTVKPLNPDKFEAWAGKLGDDIFRAKGICYFGMKGVGQKYIFQAVGTRYELKLDEWAGHETPLTQLVVIGKNLSQSAIKKELDELIDSEPDNISADTLMDIFKYK
ncbi:GTP-binding protein [Candidatus Saccharibacteria bacterium]|nr:GTP-binding protein [Candidatus Saccharibacteria bacterium]MCB9821490.1 GTP-binding protein [Candidatus Nomurabacteria bacterium]